MNTASFNQNNHNELNNGNKFTMMLFSPLLFAPFIQNELGHQALFMVVSFLFVTALFTNLLVMLSKSMKMLATAKAHVSDSRYWVAQATLHAQHRKLF